MNIITTIEKSLKDYLINNFHLSNNILNLNLNLNIDANKQQFGDITTNFALILSKGLNLSPMEFAKKVQENVKNEFIDKIEVAKPGFINIFLTLDAIKHLTRELFEHEDKFFKNNSLQPQNYNIEFVSANPTGPLHVGNGRGGIIGDVLANVLSFLRNKVVKEYYINDAGSQIEKLGLSLKIRCLQQLGESIELPEDGYQGDYLIELAKQFIKDHPGLNNAAKLQEQDLVCFSIYAQDQILGNIKQTLGDYKIHFDIWFSEKELHTNGSIECALKKLNENGALYENEGAHWFKSTEFGDDKDRVVKKSTGEYTYAAADIAYMQNKLDRGFTKLIMILGQDHHGYVPRLKAIMQALGYNPENLEVILYQLVAVKESGNLIRLSKRSGRLITLEDIIKAVGADVARFFYLNKKADAHLDFDLDLALKQTDENPVYYIQYAYVRAISILNKAQEEFGIQEINQADCAYISETEKGLIKKIVSLKSLLESIAHNYQIHLLTYYVIELAQYFHAYYGSNRVIDPNNKEKTRGRLLVLVLLRRTFYLCFKLLGITAPQKM